MANAPLREGQVYCFEDGNYGSLVPNRPVMEVPSGVFLYKLFEHVRVTQLDDTDDHQSRLEFH